MLLFTRKSSLIGIFPSYARAIFPLTRPFQWREPSFLILTPLFLRHALDILKIEAKRRARWPIFLRFQAPEVGLFSEGRRFPDMHIAIDYMS